MWSLPDESLKTFSAVTVTTQCNHSRFGKVIQTGNTFTTNVSLGSQCTIRSTYIVAGSTVGAGLVGSGICAPSNEVGASQTARPWKSNVRRNIEPSPNVFFGTRFGRTMGSGRGSGSINIDV